jgi:hypothetical protein
MPRRLGAPLVEIQQEVALVNGKMTSSPGLASNSPMRSALLRLTTRCCRPATGFKKIMPDWTFSMVVVSAYA